MKKVLVLTRNLHGEKLGSGDLFKNRGYDVKYVINSNDCPKWNIYIRIKRYLGLSIKNYKFFKDKYFELIVKKICKKYEPNIIYVCHGTQLRPKVVDCLCKDYFMALELTDRLAFFPELYDIVAHYNYVTTYSKDDYEYLTKKGIDCVFTPTGPDTKNFYHINTEKDIDISFIGELYPEKEYGERKEIIMKIINDFPSIKIFIGGKYAPIRRISGYLKWLLNKRSREVFNNKELSKEECNLIYNRSKICLNIDRNNTGNNWSDRFSNIMQTGSFQIVRYVKYIEDNFVGGIETFKNYDELKRKIVFYLEHEKERNSISTRGKEMFDEFNKKRSIEFDLVKDIEDKIESRNKY